MNVFVKGYGVGQIVDSAYDRQKRISGYAVRLANGKTKLFAQNMLSNINPVENPTYQVGAGDDAIFVGVSAKGLKGIEKLKDILQVSNVSLSPEGQYKIGKKELGKTIPRAMRRAILDGAVIPLKAPLAIENYIQDVYPYSKMSIMGRQTASERKQKLARASKGSALKARKSSRPLLAQAVSEGVLTGKQAEKAVEAIASLAAEKAKKEVKKVVKKEAKKEAKKAIKKTAKKKK